MNLLAWGEEGTDYVVNENGEASYGDLDHNNVYHSCDWPVGSQFLILPWEGQGGDFRVTSKALNDGAENSPYLGFAADASGLDQIFASISSVSEEYTGIMTGGYYTDQILSDMTAKMEAAGIRDYVAAFQSQLDAWLAAQ